MYLRRSNIIQKISAYVELGIIYILKVLWPEYMVNDNHHDVKIVLKHYFVQKILRINSSVPWPVHWTSHIIAPEKICRGSRTPGLSRGCHIDGRNGIIFGKNVWVGPHVCIISMNHDTNNFSNYVETTPIRIGNNCWLGAKCIILPGVELGDHTVVAAGAVVTKSFPEGNQLLAGVPARVIKRLPDYEQAK